MNVRLLLASLALVACGSPPEPVAPTAAAEPEAEGPAAEPAAAEPAAPARRRKPFEIYNACAEVTTLVFSDDPKADDSSRRTISPFSTSEGPRDDEGNQTVWLLDEGGEPLVKVRVTRGMKRVEVGRSCRTLDAR
jgi:hypothetical protein